MLLGLTNSKHVQNLMTLLNVDANALSLTPDAARRVAFVASKESQFLQIPSVNFIMRAGVLDQRRLSQHDPSR